MVQELLLVCQFLISLKKFPNIINNCFGYGLLFIKMNSISDPFEGKIKFGSI